MPGDTALLAGRSRVGRYILALNEQPLDFPRCIINGLDLYIPSKELGTVRYMPAIEIRHFGSAEMNLSMHSILA